MKFYKLHESVHGTTKKNTIDKVEYFWHYWDFLFTQNRNLILVDEPKFISHITLIKKIEKHLEWNRGISAKKLLKYFNHHPYFRNKNLIIRCDSDLKKEVNSLKNYIERCKKGTEEAKHLIRKDREFLKESFYTLQLKHFDTKAYTKLLLNKLDRIIFNNSDLNETNRKDLKFLCNGIIDMFIRRGYSLAFIKDLLSNTILNSSNKFNFRYEKNFGDFNKNYNNWKTYVTKEYKSLTLKDRINYIYTFFSTPKRKGFFIFKIDGIDFQSKPITIFNSEFYNPEIERFITYFKTNNAERDKENDEYCRKCELFINVDDSNSNTSKCNLIVPIDYNIEDLDHFDSFNYPTKSFLEAKNRANVSLMEFKNEIKSYSIEHYWDEILANIRVSHESILVDENFNYHKASNISEATKTVFKLDDIRERMLGEEVNYKASIKSQNSFLLHLANSNALTSSYYLEYHKLNYKTLWIECVEPYFDDIDDFLKYAKKSVLLRTNLFSKYWILLHQALRKDLFAYTYCLNDELLKKFSLQEVEIGEIITGNGLEENFELLPDATLLNEFKNEMRLFKKDPRIFIEKIDLWISNIIKTAYDERNIEVHYNIVDYYNDVSIKKDILYIITTVINVFNDAVFEEGSCSTKTCKEFINRTYEKK